MLEREAEMMTLSDIRLAGVTRMTFSNLEAAKVEVANAGLLRMTAADDAYDMCTRYQFPHADP
jgi:hypothetical protein